MEGSDLIIFASNILSFFRGKVAETTGSTLGLIPGLSGVMHIFCKITTNLNVKIYQTTRDSQFCYFRGLKRLSNNLCQEK